MGEILVGPKSFLHRLTIWGDFGVSPISGEKVRERGGLMGNYPSTPISSHLCVVGCVLIIFF